MVISNRRTIGENILRAIIGSVPHIHFILPFFAKISQVTINRYVGYVGAVILSMSCHSVENGKKTVIWAKAACLACNELEGRNAL